MFSSLLAFFWLFWILLSTPAPEESCDRFKEKYKSVQKKKGGDSEGRGGIISGIEIKAEEGAMIGLREGELIDM